jgi:probable DNA repair protein
MRDSDARIGVVVPDLRARRRQVARLFRNVLETSAQLPGQSDLPRLFHISAGEPLSAHPIVTSALCILTLSPQRNDWDVVSPLLLSPYIAGAATEWEHRGLLDVRMREAGEVQLSMASLRRLCREERTTCPVLDRTIGSWMRVRDQVPATATADVWSQTFSSLLAAMEWPSERQLTSVEYQVAEAWSRALSQFAAIGASAGDLSIGDAVSLLSRIAAETIFQPESEDTPVQVLGTLEASGLHFDHLWIAGMHDEAWPRPAKPNPFLPIRVQREAGLPRSSAERELEFASLITRRLLASSPDVVVSYPALLEDHEVSPSPLILPVRKIDRAELQFDDSPAYVETIQASREMDQLIDEQAPPIEHWERGGTRVFQYQAACPFRAFAELRLGAETLGVPTPGLDARRRGTLVHTALEEFWKEVRTHDALCSRGDIGEVIRASVRTALDRLQRDSSGVDLPQRFSELESRRLERLLGGWLEIERQRSAFEVIQPEGERYADLGGIQVRIRPDRVDRLPDGSELIIDYKTRQTSVNEWTTERPDEPQLPLYSATHDHQLAGVVFGQLKAGDLRFRGWTSAPGIVPRVESTDLAFMVGEWRTVLERLAGEFRAGHAEAGPKDRSKSCRYCSLAGLCRVAECYSLGDEEEAER